MSWVTWPTLPPWPYIVKAFKIFFSRTNKPMTLKLCMCYQGLFKLWPLVDLDLYYAKIKFGHIHFCMVKSENYYFLESVAAKGLKVAWSIQLHELMKVSEYQKLRSFFDFGQFGWAIRNQSSYDSLWQNGNENLYKWVGLHDQGGCHAHIWKKTLKIFISRTNGLMALKHGM